MYRAPIATHLEKVAFEVDVHHSAEVYHLHFAAAAPICMTSREQHKSYNLTCKTMLFGPGLDNTTLQRPLLDQLQLQVGCHSRVRSILESVIFQYPATQRSQSVEQPIALATQ